MATKPRKGKKGVGAPTTDDLPSLFEMEDNSGDMSAPLNLGMLTSVIKDLKQDLCDKMDANIDSLSKALRSEMTLIKDEFKISLTTLQTTVEANSSTIKDLERSATSCSDDIIEINKTVKTLQTDLESVKKELKAAQAKCSDLEGRSRRNNVRLVGVPENIEGNRPREFIAQLLQDILHLDEIPLLDRAHRSLREKPEEGGSPRPFIIRVHYFHVKEEILRQARETGPLLYRGKKLSIYPDFTQAVIKMRGEFNDAKTLLHKCPGVKFGLYFPAELRITLPNGDFHKFTDPVAAVDFINKDLRKNNSSPDGSEETDT